MLPVFSAAIAEIAVRAAKSFFPSAPEDKLELFRLQIQQEAEQNEVIKETLRAANEVNTAEAANPNRKWITWRELLGYACAGSVCWAFILRPALEFFIVVFGGDVSKLPEIEVTQLFRILLAMLGIGT